MRIATLGGPLPDGRILQVSGLPEFRFGSRYIVLLTASDWFYSPVVSDYAFRIEKLGGREVVVSQTGHAVMDVNSLGVELAGASVDRPNLEKRAQFDTPVLLPDATLRVHGALTKAAFLTLVKGFARARVGGTFKHNVASGKIWNVTSGAPDLSASQEVLESGPLEGQEVLACQ